MWNSILMKELSIYKEQNLDFGRLFDHLGKINGHEPDFMIQNRQKASKAFLREGLPGRKDEDYKHLLTDKLFERDYKYRFLKEIVHFDINHLFKCDIPNLNTHLITLLNGFYHGKDDHLIELPGGIRYGSMQAASKEMPHILEKHYSKYAGFGKDSFVDLNTSLARDGVFIYVPKNTKFNKPVQVVNLILSDKELFIQPRNLIVLEENTSFNLVVCDHALTIKHSLGNSVTESYVAQNANYDFTLLQNEHNNASLINHHFIHQEKDSRVETNTISLHAGLIRNNHFVTLNGEGAENYANGLYLMDKHQYIDNMVYMDHAKPNCKSEQLFKGVMDGQSKGVFSGRILVRKDSQATEAYQRNNNILLTDEAKMNSKPQLEIYADDVKCSHGATVGQIDEEAMFYLRSRGISKKEASLMMMYGFTNDVIRRIHIDSLRERIEELVYKRLKGDLARCDNCGYLNL